MDDVPSSAPRLIEGGANGNSDVASKMSPGEILRMFLPFIILIVVVVAMTGPWSKLPSIAWLKLHVDAISSLSHKKVAVAFVLTPFVGGTEILISWILILILMKVKASQALRALSVSWSQMWGAILVGPFIFGLAQTFNYSGMASSLADGFSKIGPAFIIVAPLLGFIGVALSGSNTATNAIFGAFQLSVGRILHLPTLLLPSLNSVGAEVGKPVAPQTASVGVSTSSFVRNEGQVIRHNFGWTLFILAWLVLVGLLFRYFLAGTMGL